jgi:hypothetical protein
MSKQTFTFTPSEKQIEERHEYLKKNEISTVHMDDVRRECRRILSIKNKTDICFTFIQHLMSFSVYNKEEMTDQMILWRDLAKKGKIEILAGNNREHKIDDKKVYSFIITPTHDCNFCPVSLALGTLVSGYTYVFTKEENRDRIYNYLKKYCITKDDETKDE